MDKAIEIVELEIAKANDKLKALEKETSSQDYQAKAILMGGILMAKEIQILLMGEAIKQL